MTDAPADPEAPGVSEESCGLVADIGGTNARFALTTLAGAVAIERPRTLKVAEFPTVVAAIRAYLRAVKAEGRVRAAVLAVAALPEGDRVALTNSHWRFSLAAAGGELGFGLWAINDFAANAWALPTLTEEQVTPIGPHLLPRLTDTAAILGPGTGLGVGAICLGEPGPVILETEGGHVDFAPVNEGEEQILRDLRARFGRVSYERLLSGEGLANIHRSLTGAAASLTPEEISARAAGDPDAARAVHIFCQVLGSFAGNVALMLGAWNGVFLAGGLVAALKDELLAGGFRRRFQEKGRFSPQLAEVPTLLVEEPWLGLIGAAAALRARLGLSA